MQSVKVVLESEISENEKMNKANEIFFFFSNSFQNGENIEATKKETSKNIGY